MTLWVKVEANPGADVEETVEDMLALAKRVECGVECDFNGLVLLVTSGDVAASVVRGYYAAVSLHRGRAAVVSPATSGAPTPR